MSSVTLIGQPRGKFPFGSILCFIVSSPAAEYFIGVSGISCETLCGRKEGRREII
jgi:hypothetical protein